MQAAYMRLTGANVALMSAENARFHIFSRNQNTLLHWSAVNGHVDVSRLLISSKADVDARNEKYDAQFL